LLPDDDEINNSYPLNMGCGLEWTFYFRVGDGDGIVKLGPSRCHP